MSLIKPIFILTVLSMSQLIGLNQAYADESRNGSVLSAMADPEVLAKQRVLAAAKISCKAIEDSAKRQSMFLELIQTKWDRSKMGCGLEYGSQLAAQSPDNIELQMQVLGAHIEYFENLSQIYVLIYQGIELSSELWVRWDNTKSSGGEIVKRLESLKQSTPEIKVLLAAYMLASTQKETSIKDANTAAVKALSGLEQAISRKPEALDGLGLLLTGQILLSLPEFLGGDTLRAISLLEKSIQIAPENLSMSRTLTEAYLGERENQSALTVLKKVLNVPLNSQNLQTYVDEMKVLAGMAIRAGDKALAKQISLKRNEVLEQNPFLLTRKQYASFGHGGDDPLTGEDPGQI